MITIRVSKDGERIGVFTPPEFAERCRIIAGSVWNGNAKAWVYPATPTTAVQINALFKSTGFKYDSGFSELLKLGCSVYDNAVSTMNADADKLPMPPMFRRDRPLWIHQLRAFWYATALWGGLDNPTGGGAMIPLRMGRGKTSVAIHLIANFQFDKVLIVAPAKVVNVWPEEFEKNDPLGCKVLALRNGSVKQRTRAMHEHLDNVYRNFPGKPAVIVTNYEAVRSSPLKEYTTEKIQWDCVVLDESHRIKQPSGITSKWAAKVARNSKHRLALTGTPMPHSPLDIFAQYRFLDFSILGTSWTKCRSHYADMGGFGGHQIVSYRHQDELSEKFYSIAYRIKPEEDVVARADPIKITRKAPLGKGKSMYWEMHNNMITQIKDGTIATAANALVKMLRLQQITGGHLKDEDGVIHHVDEAKGDLLADVLEDLDQREPIVVFCNFHADIDQVRKICVESGRTVSELSGRLDELADWKDGKTDVLVAQIQSGKEGISLVRAQYSIYYSVGFSLADYEQSIARTDRPGQKATEVTCIHLVVEGTIDEKVYQAISEKREIINAVMEYIKSE